MSSPPSAPASPFPPRTEPPTPTSIVKRLYFCRHGETAMNAAGGLQGQGSNYELNDTGREQARCMAQVFKDLEVDYFVSSDLKRAIQTAEVSQKLYPKEIPLTIEPALKEISWGVWEGTRTSELDELVKSWDQGDYNASAPGGESPIQVEARCMPAVYALLKNRPEQNIVVVVHGRLLRILLSSLMFRNLDYMSTLTHHNCCINVVDCIIETDPSRISKSEAAEPGPQLPFANLSRLPDPHVLDSPRGNTCHASAHRPSQPTFSHPVGIKCIPRVLDYRAHLPEHMNGYI
ncbi:histidine phosphatase superfamily [Polychytrium aggregatum]|uniref:histidine phosphatase superfamily n=1 Tax=Polychytrium aggregatum TaxID=110093 RepID=UPI0022FF3FCB|nr:histidine phosphatase superfamily [Polychytrium aggregatum]KAI9205208.1 histidine phosphatase superfamily [Polychytrium aggregatum]